MILAARDFDPKVAADRLAIENVLCLAADLCGCEVGLSDHVVKMSRNALGVYLLRMKSSAAPVKTIVVHVDDEGTERMEAACVEFQR